MQITIIPSLVTCYLFFRCGIEKESLSWAFPQHSPTHAHTIFYRHISFLRYRHNSRTHIFDVWVEYILRDVVYPSCLTWFQSGGGTKLSFSRALHVSKDKAWKLCKPMQHILNYTSIWWSWVFKRIVGLFVKTRAILPLYYSITAIPFQRYSKWAMKWRRKQNVNSTLHEKLLWRRCD